MAGYRPPYTLREEKDILQYIVEYEAYHRLRGDAFWQEMEQAKVTNRTWQSLKQHFRKKLHANVRMPAYGLDFATARKILLGFEASSTKRLQHKSERDPDDARRSPNFLTCSSPEASTDDETI